MDYTPSLARFVRLMPHVALAATLGLAGSSAGAAHQPSVTPTITFAAPDSGSPREREIRAAEQQMHQAYVKGDRTLFRSMYADDATFTYSSGRTVGADERIRDLRTFPDLRDTVQAIRFYGNATAIVNMQSAYAEPSGTPVRLQIVRVWVKQGEAWKVAAFQSTPVR